MQIPSSHINSSLTPARSDVYSRQLAKQSQARQKEQQQRETLRQTQLEQELLELTCKPRINSNHRVDKSFNQRQLDYEEKSRRKYAILNEIQSQNTKTYTFSPKLNPASLYLAQTKRQTEIYNFKPSKTQQIQCQGPEITKYASSLYRDENIYEKLSKPRVTPSDLSFNDTVKTQPQITKEEQLLHAEKMHSEYSKYLAKREILKEQFERENTGKDADIDIERKVKRDVLAFNAKIRKIENKGQTKEMIEEPTFQPEINEISKLLTNDQDSFESRYYAEIQNLKNQQLINQKKKQLQDYEIYSFQPVTNNKKTTGDSAMIEFFERQEKLLSKKKQLQIETESQKRLEKSREIQYIQENCGKSHVKKVPQMVKQNLLALEQEERDNLADFLLNMDNLDEASRQHVEKQLCLGGGVPLSTAYLMDSISKHAERIKIAREQKLELAKKLAFRE